jgi:mRNA degradation ribonuclease J1/J2
LASDGFVVAVVPYSGEGQWGAPPRIISHGFVFYEQAAELFDGASERVQQVLAQHASRGREELEATLVRELEDYFYVETKRRPIVAAVLSPANFS